MSEQYRIPDLILQDMSMCLDCVRKTQITHEPLVSSRAKKSEAKNISEDARAVIQTLTVGRSSFQGN